MKRILLLAVSLLAVVGCENDGERTSNTPEPTSTRTTLTAAELQPPATQRTRPGRPAVVYDPCTYIDDRTIVEAGFDADTRERDDADDLTTQFGCAFESDRRYLDVISLNKPYDDARHQFAEYSRQLPPINGREAFLTDDPASRFSCQVTLRTKSGLAYVLSSVKVQYSETDEPCDGIVEIATLIEKTIGPEN